MRKAFKRSLLPVFCLLLAFTFLLSGCVNNRNSDNGGNESGSGNGNGSVESGGSGNADGGAQAGGIDWERYNTLAEAFVATVAAGDFEAAYAMFDETMSSLADADEIKSWWDEIIALAGDYIEIHDIQNAYVDGYYICGVIMRHSNTGFGWNIVFSDDGLVAGINTAGTMPLPDSSAQGRSSEPTPRDGFTDYPVIIGEGGSYPVSGVLSIPDDAAGLLPAVVIAPGSGPTDMDGTIGGAKIYRDIAEHLAANGIAALRYDKRTYAHGAQLMRDIGGALSVMDEYGDIIPAAEFLKADGRIDPDRVYLIGHSLGAMLAPRLHASGGDFAGLVLMAGSPRPLGEIMVEQSRDSMATSIELGLAQEADLKDTIAELDLLEEMINNLGSIDNEQAQNTELPLFGSHAYYLKEMAAHPFEFYAQDMDVPVLVLQGGKDFKIRADTDYAAMQDVFAGRSDAAFRLYDDLNHAFITSAASNFVEHASEILTQTGHVDSRVLQDIADWIMAA